MNAVAKHLKRLRQQAGLTQEDLAERLHVTRQTVSSWETSKTQPDIETLTALAEALGTDVNELIYGTPPAGQYPRFQRRYVVWTAVCGAVVLAGLVLQLTVQAHIREWVWRMEHGAWISWSYLLIVPALLYFAAGALVPALLSLLAEVRIPSRRVRGVLLAVALLPLGRYLLWITLLFLPVPRPHFLSVWTSLLAAKGNEFLRCGPLFLSGLCFFLAANRK